MSFDLALTKQIGTTEIALTLEPGPSAGSGATILFGRSGVGKTSVLNMVAGLLRPDSGHVRVGGDALFGDGVDVPPEHRRAGYVFQEPRLFPHLRVRGNLLYGAGRSAEIGDRLNFLGIADLLDRWPHTLSGGEAMAWRLSWISVALSLAALVASEVLARRMGAGRHVL